MPRSNVWILGASGNLGCELAKMIDSSEYQSVSTLYLVDRVPFPCPSCIANCETRYLVSDIARGDFMATLKPNFAIPQIFINLIAKDYPVTTTGLPEASSHPFSVTTEEYSSAMSITAGSSYNLIRLIIENNISPVHVVLIGSIYNYMLPDPHFYSANKSKYKPVSYGSAKHAQKALMQQAAVYFAQNQGRCNSIAFGGIDLDQSEAFKAAYSKRSPQSRLVPINDALDALKWLAFHSPPSMNGAELVIDGGISLT